MKHTPGPWRIIAHSIIVAAEHGICKLFGEGMNFGQQIANARLIAEAPMMYAALEAVAKDIERHGRVQFSTMGIIISTLARAGGES